MIFDLKQLKTKLGDGNGLQNLSQALLEFAGL